MCNLIREALAELPPEKLKGTVEVDETYMGNSRRYFNRKRKPGRGAGKPPVFGRPSSGWWSGAGRSSRSPCRT